MGNCDTMYKNYMRTELSSRKKAQVLSARTLIAWSFNVLPRALPNGIEINEKKFMQASSR